jgi:hypothetical protein
VMHSFSASKAVCCAPAHVHSASFLVSMFIGQAILAKPQMQGQ